MTDLGINHNNKKNAEHLSKCERGPCLCSVPGRACECDYETENCECGCETENCECDDETENCKCDDETENCKCDDETENCKCNLDCSCTPMLNFAHYTVREFLESDRLSPSCEFFRLEESNDSQYVEDLLCDVLLGLGPHGIAHTDEVPDSEPEEATSRLTEYSAEFFRPWFADSSEFRCGPGMKGFEQRARIVIDLLNSSKPHFRHLKPLQNCLTRQWNNVALFSGFVVPKHHERQPGRFALQSYAGTTCATVSIKLLEIMPVEMIISAQLKVCFRRHSDMTRRDTDEDFLSPHLKPKYP